MSFTPGFSQAKNDAEFFSNRFNDFLRGSRWNG